MSACCCPGGVAVAGRGAACSPVRVGVDGSVAVGASPGLAAPVAAVVVVAVCNLAGLSSPDLSPVRNTSGCQ